MQEGVFSKIGVLANWIKSAQKESGTKSLF
jgi:hypothetical protein